MEFEIPDFFKTLEPSITVCDKNYILIYMNDKAVASYRDAGGKALLGQDIRICHRQASLDKMKAIMETGIPNAYTISKNGIRKLIYQAPWKSDGVIAGIVEFSIPIPDEMPHYVRS